MYLFPISFEFSIFFIGSFFIIFISPKFPSHYALHMPMEKRRELGNSHPPSSARSWRPETWWNRSFPRFSIGTTGFQSFTLTREFVPFLPCTLTSCILGSSNRKESQGIKEDTARRRARGPLGLGPGGI